MHIMKNRPHVKIQSYIFICDRVCIMYVYFYSLLREKINLKLQLQLDFCWIFANQH